MHSHVNVVNSRAQRIHMVRGYGLTMTIDFIDMRSICLLRRHSYWLSHALCPTYFEWLFRVWLYCLLVQTPH